MSASRYPKRKRTLDDVAQGPGKIRSTGDGRLDSAERGRRLLPVIVDELARDVPNDTWISCAKSNVASEGFENISDSQLRNAINRAALWLQEHVPKSESKVIAYLGPSDARYLIFTLAAAKVGMVMFLPAPHNALDTQQELAETTHSSVLLRATTYVKYAEDNVRSTAIKGIAVPEQDELLDDTQDKQVAYTKSYEEERREPFAILHTSGTTHSTWLL